MWMRTLKTAAQGLLTGVVVANSGTLAYQARAEKPAAPAADRGLPVTGLPLRRFTPEQFAALHKLIKPQPGELRFHEIPWLLDVWEARRKAAAEGKPILVWSGAGGAPIGVC